MIEKYKLQHYVALCRRSFRRRRSLNPFIYCFCLVYSSSVGFLPPSMSHQYDPEPWFQQPNPSFDPGYYMHIPSSFPDQYMEAVGSIDEVEQDTGLVTSEEDLTRLENANLDEFY